MATHHFQPSQYHFTIGSHQPVLRISPGDTVVTRFLEVIDEYGPPASTLTDNGRIYTARFGGGRNAFEYLLPILGIYNYPYTNVPIYPFGSMAVIFYGVIVGYSVLQYQLLDVRVTLNRGAA